MTKKDFVLIAKVLSDSRDQRETEHDAVINSLAYTFAARLAQTSPRFDAKIFLAACGVPRVS